MTYVPDPALSTIDQAQRVKEIHPVSTHGQPDGAIIDVENLADNDVHPVYFDMQHREHGSLQTIMSDGTVTDDIQIWIDATDEAETNPAAVTDWTDVTVDIYGTATVDNTAGAVDLFEFIDTHVSCVWFRARYQRIAGVANDGDIKVNLKRWW